MGQGGLKGHKVIVFIEKWGVDRVEKTQKKHG